MLYALIESSCPPSSSSLRVLQRCPVRLHRPNLGRLHELILVRHQPRYEFFARLLQLPGDEDFVEDVVRLVKVEDEVELAHVAEVLVQDLHVVLDDLQDDELVLGVVHGEAEVERRVPAVDELQVSMLHHVAELRRPRQDLRRHLLHHLPALLLRVRLVVLAKPDLALPAEQEREVDHASLPLPNSPAPRKLSPTGHAPRTPFHRCAPVSRTERGNARCSSRARCKISYPTFDEVAASTAWAEIPQPAFETVG